MDGQIATKRSLDHPVSLIYDVTVIKTAINKGLLQPAEMRMI